MEKKDLYQDTRSEKENDTMDNWDEEKLRKVILSKHGNPKTTTDKVCKYFIEAVENGKYGWFWICPNGGDKCMYRHSLPEGFVLKTNEQKRLEGVARETAKNYAGGVYRNRKRETRQIQANTNNNCQLRPMEEGPRHRKD